MEEIKVSEMLQADSIEKDNAVMIIQDGVNKKASGSIETATGTSLSLTSVADTCKVTSNSKNLFDEEIEQGGFNGGTPEDNTTRVRSSNFTKVNANTTYTVSVPSNMKVIVIFYNASMSFISSTDGWANITRTFTTPANTNYVKLLIGKQGDGNVTPSEVSNVQLEEGSTATSYNPYNTEVGIAVKELQLEDGSIQGSDGTPVSAQGRRRTANFINIDATKTHVIKANGYQVSVYQYKADGTYLGSSQGWQNTPHTFLPKAETGKIKIVIPNSNAKTYDLSIDDIRPQVIILKPGEEDVAFTYETQTIVQSNGSVTIEYNTQSRLLNNNDLEKIEKDTNKISDDHLVNVGTSIDDDYKVNILYYGDNLFNTTGATAGKYLSTTGTEETNSTWGFTDYIEVIHGKTYVFRRTDNGPLGNTPAICFYTADKTFISGANYNSRNASRVAPPSNAKYARISYVLADGSLYIYKCIDPPKINVDGEDIYDNMMGQFRAVSFGSTGSSSSISFTDSDVAGKCYLIFSSKSGTDGTYCDVLFVRMGGTAIARLGGTGTATPTVSISGNTMTIGGLSTYAYTMVYQVMKTPGLE